MMAAVLTEYRCIDKRRQDHLNMAGGGLLVSVLTVLHILYIIFGIGLTVSRINFAICRSIGLK
jgi:hypothetical protein